MKTNTVLVFTAHNDDQIIGAGGTLANYSKNGIVVIVYVFSFGEKSHPHFQKKEIITTRVKEMQESDKILNITQSYFLGFSEGSFPEDFKKKDCKTIIRRAIETYQPIKIFTHSNNDPHPDHHAVNKFISDITSEINYNGEVFTFDIWNPFSIWDRGLPKLVVDITNTFSIKVKALRCHKSQFTALMSMIPSIYVRAFVHGLRYGFTYAEKFTKIR